MKKCPFCKAEIEDNARFCLYCMKPLAEKETIASPREKKRYWPLLIAGVIFLAVLLCLLLAFCAQPKKTEPIQDNGTSAASEPEEIPSDTSEPIGEPPVETLPQETLDETEPQKSTEPSTAPSTAPTENTKPPTVPPTAPIENTTPPTVPPTAPIENTISPTVPPTAPIENTTPPTVLPTVPIENTTPPADPSVSVKPDPDMEPVPSQCSHSYTLSDLLEPTCAEDGFIAYTCDKCGDSYQESIAAAGHQYTPATCLSPKVCKECGQIDGDPLGHSYTNGYCSRCNTPDPAEPMVVFEYRGVGPNDYFGYVSDSDIVITGVRGLSPDGAYEIPAYIDGKRVVGIVALAFNGSDARVVTLPETVIRVNQNAFTGCSNLESLYIKSDALFLSRSAFSTPLTIYCSADCMVDDDLYGACYLKDIVRVYGAQWKEWNGK